MVNDIGVVGVEGNVDGRGKSRGKGGVWRMVRAVCRGEVFGMVGVVLLGVWLMTMGALVGVVLGGFFVLVGGVVLWKTVGWWAGRGVDEEDAMRAELGAREWIVSGCETDEQRRGELGFLRDVGGLEFCRMRGIGSMEWPLVSAGGVVLSGLYAGTILGTGMGSGDVYEYGGVAGGMEEVGVGLPGFEMLDRAGLIAGIYNAGGLVDWGCAAQAVCPDRGHHSSTHNGVIGGGGGTGAGDGYESGGGMGDSGINGGL